MQEEKRNRLPEEAVIYVVTGNQDMARLWARENGILGKDYRYVQDAYDLEGKRREDIRIVEPIFLEIDTFRDRERKEKIMDVLDALP